MGGTGVGGQGWGLGGDWGGGGQGLGLGKDIGQKLGLMGRKWPGKAQGETGRVKKEASFMLEKQPCRVNGERRGGRLGGQANGLVAANELYMPALSMCFTLLYL